MLKRRDLKTPMRAYWDLPSQSASAIALIRTALLLLLMAGLTACSSGEEQDPLQNADLATFRLTDVTTETSDQASLAKTETIRRRITFITKVKDVATGEDLQEGVVFKIYLGSRLLGTPATNIGGLIKWDLEDEFEKTDVTPYELYTFRIEASTPYSGFRMRQVQVNFQKEGRQAGIDITDGQRAAPTAVVPIATVTNAAGETVIPKPKFFPYNTWVPHVEDVPYALSRATGKRNHFIFNMQTCLMTEGDTIKKTEIGINFSIEHKGIDGKLNYSRTVPTMEGGCLPYDLEVKNFNLFAPQRFYPVTTKICSENASHGDHCIEYTFYFNPWKHFDIGAQDFVYFQGKADTPISSAKHPPAAFVDGTSEFLALLPKRQPRLYAKGYSSTFIGRTYRIDPDLNMKSIRRYQFSVEPMIEHWTIDNPERKETLESGMVSLKLLLRKAHGDSVHEFPIETRDEEIRKKESACFGKKSIFDLPKDKDFRHWCYARSYMDHVIRRIKVNDKLMTDILPLEFDDIRYVTSRNILMMELSLDQGSLQEEEIQIKSETFVAAFSPLKEDAYRRWSKQYDQYFVEESQDRTRVRPLDYFDTAVAVRTHSAEDAGLSSSASLSRLISEMPVAEKFEFDGVDYFSKMDPVGYTPEANTVYEPLARTGEVIDANAPDSKIVLPTFESIDEIIQIVRDSEDRDRFGDNYVELRELAKEDMKLHNLPLPVSIYRIKNGLETKETARFFPFTEDDLETLNAAMVPRTRPDKTESQNLAVLELYKFSGIGINAKRSVDDHDLKRVIDKSCDALYPITSDEAQREAEQFAEAKKRKAISEFIAQKEILCNIHNMVAAKIYDDIILEDADLTGVCEQRKLCLGLTHIPVEKTEQGTLEGIANWVGGLIGESDEAPEMTCAKGIDNDTALLLTDLFAGTLDEQSEFGKDTVNWALELIEPLARKWLHHAPFARVRDEVIRRRNPQLHLDEILVNPDDPEMAHLFEPKLLKERCKENPFDYIHFNFTEHVTTLKNADRERYPKIVDVTNLRVSASISRLDADYDQNVYGTSHSSMVYNNADINVGVSGYGWAGWTIAGNGLQMAISGGTNMRKAVQTHKNWFVRDVRLISKGDMARASNATAKTINAEYATFLLEVQTMKCVSIVPAVTYHHDNRGHLTHPGYLLCGEKPDPKDESAYKEIEETWYYTYLYFRNNNSGLTDTASSLVERPWTVTMRGEQLFEQFRDTLAQKAVTIVLESTAMPDPQAPLREAYVKFRDMRTDRFLNSPGLLKRISIIEQEPMMVAP